MKNIFSKGILLAGMVLLAACNPFKVTDPSDPRFDVSKFDLNDYKNHTEMAEVIGVLFKVGSSREGFEKVFVEFGGARFADITNEASDGSINHIFGSYTRKDINLRQLVKTADKIILYGHGGKRNNWGWGITVFYDQNERAIQIFANNHVAFK